MQLHSYMSTAFPGLSLRPPLFYRWPVGIRFELGVEGIDMAYDDVVIHRARTLYEAVFRPEDLGFVVSGQIRYISLGGVGIRARRRRHRPTLFQLSKRYSLGLHGPAGRQIQIHDAGDTRELTKFRFTQIEPRGIDYEFILKAKANAELYCHRPAIDDRVYFVNVTRNIILHMYDDPCTCTTIEGLI
jgi:hypothetical protein